MRGRVNPWGMSAYSLTNPNTRASSPHSVGNSVERVLELRVLREVAGVIGVLQYRTISGGLCAVAVIVRIGVCAGVEIVIVLGAEVNPKHDGDHYHGNYPETR